MFGKRESYEAIPNAEDTIWQMFTKGRNVYHCVDSLEIGQYEFFLFVGDAEERHGDVMILHGTRVVNFIQILRGIAVLHQSTQVPMIETVREEDLRDVYVTPDQGLAFKSYSPT